MGKKSKLAHPHRRSGKAPQEPESMALMRLVEAKKYLEIEAAARRILEKRPRHPLALKALGFAMIGLARYEEALPIVEHALDLNPKDPELHNNRGILLSMLMRWDESLSAFENALALEGDEPETLRNLGVAYVRMRRWNDAVPHFLKAIECYPGDYVEAIGLLAEALLGANRVDEAWVCYNELWKGDNENLGALAQLISVSLRRCDWAHLRDWLALLREKTDNFRMGGANPFSPLAWPGVSSAELKTISANYLASMIPSGFLVDQPSFPGREWNRSTERLKIGYFSADFRNHPVGQVVVEAIERHDRSRVEVFGYSLGADDASPLRQRLSRAFEHFVDLKEAGFVETMERVRSDGIQILVDLHGWTSDGRPESLAMRCAPIQVSWLGYAGTIGHRRLADYLIGDPVVTPLEDAPHYFETIVNLPTTYMPADTLKEPGPPPRREEEGLPETGFVYCSFNNSYKFNPDVFDLWARILKAVPDSVLWLSQPPGEGGERLRKEIESRGVDPVRLVLALRVNSLENHHARIQLADLALDPFPYNSHSTGVDALWAGVPMVSLYGETFPGRVGASLLRAAGLEALIATSVERYFELAVELSGAREKLRRYRQQLASRRALPLFDARVFSANLEEAYFRMWDDFCAGIRRPIVVGQ